MKIIRGILPVKNCIRCGAKLIVGIKRCPKCGMYIPHM